MDKRLSSPVARGRLGGLTRARNMSPHKRSASARKAAKARWQGYDPDLIPRRAVLSDLDLIPVEVRKPVARA